MMTPYTVKLITAAAILFAVSAAAFGAQAQPSGSKSGNNGAAAKVELTVEQALNVSGGLDQLVSYDAVDKEGKPTKGFYKFSADLRIVIATNIDAGRTVQSRFQAARNAVIMTMSDGTGRVADEKTALLSIEVDRLMKAPSRAEFIRIKATDLKLEDNPIPAPVLSLIIPILDR